MCVPPRASLRGRSGRPILRPSRVARRVASQVSSQLQMEKAASAASSLVFGLGLGVLSLVLGLVVLCWVWSLRVLCCLLAVTAERAEDGVLGLCGGRGPHSRKVPPRSGETLLLGLRAPTPATSAEAPLRLLVLALRRLLMLTLLVVCGVMVTRRRCGRGLRVPVGSPHRIPRGLIRVGHPARVRRPDDSQHAPLVALDTRRAVLQRTRDGVLDSQRSEGAPRVQELAAQRVRELVGPALRAHVRSLAAPSLAAEVVECAAGTRVLEANTVLVTGVTATGNHGALLIVVEGDHGLQTGLLGCLRRLTRQPLSARSRRLGSGLLGDPIQIQVAPAAILLPLHQRQLADAAAVAEGAIAEGEVVGERTLGVHLGDDKASHSGQANQTPPTRTNYRAKAAG
jgi:hypothetical protein